jgi:hypothetical protein
VAGTLRTRSALHPVGAHDKFGCRAGGPRLAAAIAAFGARNRCE